MTLSASKHMLKHRMSNLVAQNKLNLIYTKLFHKFWVVFHIRTIRAECWRVDCCVFYERKITNKTSKEGL